MEWDSIEFGAGLLFGLIIMMIFASLFIFSYSNDVKELGSSICLEEHNADFVKYYDGVLTCKELDSAYNGIFVEVE